MVQQKEATIDGKKVIVVQLAARRALALKIKIIQLLGAPLLTMIGSAVKKDPASPSVMDREINMDSAAAAVELLAAKMDPDSFYKLVIEVMAGTKVQHDTGILDVTDQTFDIIFSGDLTTMYKVLWFSLKVNFEGFFNMAGIGNLMDRVNQVTTPGTPAK